MLQKLPQLTKVGVLYSFLFLAFGSLIETLHSPIQTVSSVAQPAIVRPTSELPANTPTELVIPRLGLNLPIVAGQYDPASKTWTLTDTSVQHAAMTSLPNSLSGNMLLYGHNTPKVLASTDRLVEGDIAQVRTKDGRIYTYVFSSGRLVNPDDTTVLEQTESARLTLLTCDGLWDEKRRVMTFNFESVK